MTWSNDGNLSELASPLFELTKPSDRNSRCMQVLPSFEMESHSAMVIADAPGVRASLARALERSGIEVRTAVDASEAQRQLNQRSVDLVIADDDLPTMPGVNLLEWVRAKHPCAIRVLMTGHTQLSVIRAAINRAGVAFFLTRPWDSRILREVIHAVKRQEAVGVETGRPEGLLAGHQAGKPRAGPERRKLRRQPGAAG